MRVFYSFFLAVFTSITVFAATINVTYMVNPATFNETESITVTFSGINEATWGVSSSHALYLWGWSFDAATNTSADCPTNGTWANSNEANKLTYVSTGVYSITMTPATFYARTGLGKIGMLVKTKTGSTQSQDIILPVGKFQLTLTNPAPGSVTIVPAGSSVNITATTSLPANYQLKANGSVINSSTSATSYNYNYVVTADSNMELIAADASNPSSTQSKTFTILPTPTVQSAAMPSYMKQGISYDVNDNTKVGLALYAPGKSFVHIIGSFNNWTPSSGFLMKRDTANPDIFWMELSGLSPQAIYTFQYRTNDGVKVADPFSPIVLSPDDDPYISASIYPNIPPYPAGQQYDVSIIQTGMPAYNWTVTNFQKPAKENLIVYEVLVRDFTSQKSFQGLIDKIPYIKGLNVNAVELMPVMEFDGNISWGYNPGFHYALDKAYGPADKLKEFIDKCHQNGIAVILDIALNHATGRSPIERLWSTSPDGGYGGVAANNPYFNQNATHAYGVFYDLNHSSTATRYYVNRVIEQWTKEFKIDGLRWDLTKGFTQNCATGDEACTNGYQQDRVDVLKLYSDYQWSYDPNFYVIFEHLGIDSEEQQWANYRINEGKGVILWDKLSPQFNQNTMGYASNSDFGRENFVNHGFTDRRNISYAESHDEERMMYNNLSYGASSGSYNVKNLATALEREKALGAVLLPVPGPKMIWQFGELGYDFSINRCENGTTNSNCRTDPKPVAFTIGYDTDANRKAIYNTWAKILAIRLANPVFNTKTFTIQSGNLMPRIYIWNDALPSSILKNVVILANFTTASQNIVPDFPYTGTWINLMDNTSLAVSNTAAPITIEPGGFRIYGNTYGAMGIDEVVKSKNEVSLSLLQNPVSGGVANIRYNNADNGVLSIYDLTGKEVKNYKTSKKSGDQELSINGLSAGMYIIQLKSDKGMAMTKMIVK